jgi:hypothetical protein
MDDYEEGSARGCAWAGSGLALFGGLAAGSAGVHPMLAGIWVGVCAIPFAYLTVRIFVRADDADETGGRDR